LKDEIVILKLQRLRIIIVKNN